MKTATRTAQNYFTGTEYQGRNAQDLNSSTRLNKHEENQWATYKQWYEGGYQVQKGEHGTSIQVVREDEKTKKTVVKWYKVFNIAQVKEIEEDE